MDFDTLMTLANGYYRATMINLPNLPPGTPDPDLLTKVRPYLKTRYEHRLSQKLAGRQPANLRILPSVDRISDESAGQLMTLQKEDVFVGTVSNPP